MGIIDLPLSYKKDFDKNYKTYEPDIIIDKFKKIKEIFNKSANLTFWWTGAPQILNTMKIMNAFGYKFISVYMVWIKTNSKGSINKVCNGKSSKKKKKFKN
jgi:N6-adenosine-specific RNA methylase IME4